MLKSKPEALLLPLYAVLITLALSIGLIVGVVQILTKH